MNAATLHELPVGQWRPDVGSEGPALVAVAEGLLMRILPLGVHESGVLVGPGEMATLTVNEDAYLPQSSEWRVLASARVTTIDVESISQTAAWARVSRRLVDNLEDQLRRACELVAIGHLPRVEDRVLALMFHLAERYGRVAPGHVVVPIDLTHSIIGTLIGARRPTVSLALRHLDEAGLLERRADGHWLLLEGSADLIGAGAGRPPQPVGGEPTTAPAA